MRSGDAAYLELVNNYAYKYNSIMAVNPGTAGLAFEWWDDPDFVLYPSNWSSAQNFMVPLGIQGPALDLNATYTPPNSPTYILSPTYRALYPRFSAIVDQLPAFIKAHPKVLYSLVQYTGFSREQIYQMIQPGTGPTIQIVNSLSSDVVGHFQRPNQLQINAEWVAQLENSNYTSPGYILKPATEQAMAFFLTITVFHESVHYGRYLMGMNSNSVTETNGSITVTKDAGEAFESKAFNVRVTDYNVGTTNETSDYMFYLPN